MPKKVHPQSGNAEHDLERKLEKKGYPPDKARGTVGASTWAIANSAIKKQQMSKKAHKRSRGRG